MAGGEAPEPLRVELRDGSHVLVRPVRADDKDAIADAFRRMSERSRYQRFLTVTDALSTGELRYLTEVDHHDHDALVAYDAASGDGVGVARFVRDPADRSSAEAAVAVVDDWQRRGLGSALSTLIADRARAEGVGRFTALLLAGNTAMMALLESLGPMNVVSSDGPLVEVEIALPADGIGEHMAGVLRVAATGGAEAVTDTGELPAGG